MTAEAWMLALRDVSDTQLLWALEKVTTENDRRTFFPTPNELRSYIRLERVPESHRIADGPPPTFRKRECHFCVGTSDAHTENCRRGGRPKPAPLAAVTQKIAEEIQATGTEGKP